MIFSLQIQTMADIELTNESKQKLINNLNQSNGSLAIGASEAGGLNQSADDDPSASEAQLIEMERKLVIRRSVLSLKNGNWGEDKQSVEDKTDPKEKISSSSPTSLNAINPKNSQSIRSTSSVGRFPPLNKLINRLGKDRFRTWVIVIILGLINLSMVMFSGFLQKDSKVKEGTAFRLNLREDQRIFDLLDQHGNTLVKIRYGVSIPDDIKPVKCSKLSKDGQRSYMCRDWLYRASLNIGIDGKPEQVNCYNVDWRSYTSKEKLRDCIELRDGFWYGMGQVRDSPWPLNSWIQPMAPFVTSATLNDRTPFGSIIRRYWLSSKGVAISVPLDIPLHMSYNETMADGRPSNQLCFQAAVNRHPYSAETEVKLEYTVCTGADVKTLHTEFSKNWTQSALEFDVDRSPEWSFVSQSIWSTQQLSTLNQSELDRFTKSIHSLNNNVTGYLLVDSRWESQLGELKMNETYFPNANDTFKAIANRGWKTMLTVTPFIDINAQLLLQASSEKRIVLDDNLQVPLLTRCSLDEDVLQFCAVLDIMQKNNGEWFKRRLQERLIHRYPIEALMFQGIEVSRMPQYQHNQLYNVINPDYYQVYYMDIAGSTAKRSGMTSAAGVKDFQGFLRISPLANNWTSLASIIPTVLSLGLIGYAVINTGSVGGDVLQHERDDELFVRWLELAQFLPIVQYSKVEAINALDIGHIKAFKKYQNIRRNDLLPVMRTCLIENNKNGWPIIRPMWWLEPSDPEFFHIKDQFAIGDDIIVAPILHKGQTRRNVVLPRGMWQDMITLKSVRGGKVLFDYRVELNQIAYFRRQQDNQV